LDGLDGVVVTVIVLVGPAVLPAPHAAASKAIEVRPHAARIRRPVIADALMVNIPFI